MALFLFMVLSVEFMKQNALHYLLRSSALTFFEMNPDGIYPPVNLPLDAGDAALGSVCWLVPDLVFFVSHQQPSPFFLMFLR